ncbi:MAG TPA: dipeptidase [Planctomycetota bacterium]
MQCFRAFRRVSTLVLLLVVLPACAGVRASDFDWATALAVHHEGFVFDGHNDLPWAIRSDYGGDPTAIDLREPQPQLHTDLPRLRKGGVGAQFWSAYIPADSATPVADFREQIELIHAMCAAYPQDLAFCDTADQVEAAIAEGRIASLIGVEGGHAIGNSLQTLRGLRGLGVRYLTLTHSDTLDWADAATDAPRHDGLTDFGEQVVRTCNELGILVDISHVSPATMADALRVSRAPVIASHSSAFAIAAHPRNVPDDMLRAVAANGGVVMVNFFSGFLEPEAAGLSLTMFDEYRRLRAEHPDDEGFRSAFAAYQAEHPMPRGTIGTLVDHIDHIVKVAGLAHVGLGSDYDGVSLLPEGLEDVSTYPAITAELLRRGYAKAEIHAILGGNALRVLRQAEVMAARMNAAPAR